MLKLPYKNSSSTIRAQTVVVDVSLSEYQAELSKGLQEDETLQPGQHTFRRGGFLQRHPDAEVNAQSTPAKVRISINIDSDILEYFKLRATQLNAAPYQTQINNMLRKFMEQEQAGFSVFAYADTLLADQHFIDAVAQRIAERTPAYKTET